MDVMYVDMTIEEYMDLEPCGNVHPNHPDVVCIKKGKCPTDWHMAKRTEHRANRETRYTWIVQWGKDLESFVATFGGPIVGQLLRIDDRLVPVEVHQV